MNEMLIEGSKPLNECLASESESTSSNSVRSKEKKEHIFPPVLASQWTYEDLQKLGIRYAVKPITLPEFMYTLKAKYKIKRDGWEKLPSIFKALEQVTKGFWGFSFDHRETNDMLKSGDADRLNRILDNDLAIVENAIGKLKTRREALETHLSDEFSKESDNKM